MPVMQKKNFIDDDISKVWLVHIIETFKQKCDKQPFNSDKTRINLCQWGGSGSKTFWVVGSGLKLISRIRGCHKAVVTPTIYDWTRKNPHFKPVLWNRNYLLRFRFWLLKSYGSGSDFWKVMVPVPVPTFERVPVPVPVPAPYLDHKKKIFL